MDWGRFWRHVAMTPSAARRMFPPATMDAIEEEVRRREKHHRGEVRFAVEAELSTWQLWRGVGARERAIEVFARLGVGNTRERTGVLLYVLLADRRVEIVADRGIDAIVGAEAWRRVCARMEEHFRAGRFRDGAVAGIREASELIESHFPAAAAGDVNELPDRPVRL